MRAFSTTTNNVDPYRAGIELGKALSAFAPEAVLLFSTIQYNGSPELLEGFFDGLGHHTLLIGGTGDGFYETRGTGDWGAVALGLHSDGKVQWRAAVKRGLNENPEQVTRECLQACQIEHSKLCLFFSDFRTDATRIEKVLEKEVACPIVGGFTGDDNRVERAFQFCGGEVYSDAAVALCLSGDVNFSIRVGNTIAAIGNSGVVNSADGTEVCTIDGVSAQDFVERETGKPVLYSDRGVTTFTLIDHDNPQIRRLRSIVQNRGKNDGAIGLYGGIDAGKRVQVCLAKPSELVAEVQQIATQLKQEKFDAGAALIVSCAGRKWLLGSSVSAEVHALTQQFSTLPLAGFPSFGEIGPVQVGTGYSANLFHNMTYVLLLFGR